MTPRPQTGHRVWRTAVAAFLAGCLVIGSGATPAAASVGEGDYRIVGPARKCMDVAGGNPHAGTPIVLHTCSRTAVSQQWHYDSRHQQIEAFGKCLDVPGGRFENRVRMRLWSCDGSGAQSFQLRATDYGYTIQPYDVYTHQLQPFCVEVAGGFTDDWTPIQLYDCNTTASQVWNFRRL